MAQQTAQIDFSQPPPEIDFSAPPPNDALIATKYGLPAGTDLTKGYFGQDKKLKIDPVQFSRAYAELNPGAPTPQSFFGRAWDEAHDIVSGLFSQPNSVVGTEAPDIKGTVAGVKGRIEEAKEHPAAAAGAATTDLIAMALPFVIDKLSLPSRTELASKLYTPEGQFKPGLKALVHPTEIPEYLVKKALPPPTDLPTGGVTGGPLPSAEEFYQTTGAERAKVFERELREQLKAQRVAAREAKNVPQPSPFGGATSTVTPLGGASLPAPGGSTSVTGAGLPQGTSTPFVSKFTPQEPSRIVTPESAPPPINRTLVSYDAQTLVKMAKGGDIDALNELIRNPRGVDISKAIPNAKYLLEANRATNIYGGPRRGTLSEMTGR